MNALKYEFFFALVNRLVFKIAWPKARVFMTLEVLHSLLCGLLWFQNRLAKGQSIYDSQSITLSPLRTVMVSKLPRQRPNV